MAESACDHVIYQADCVWTANKKLRQDKNHVLKEQVGATHPDKFVKNGFRLKRPT